MNIDDNNGPNSDNDDNDDNARESLAKVHGPQGPRSEVPTSDNTRESLTQVPGSEAPNDDNTRESLTQDLGPGTEAQVPGIEAQDQDSLAEYSAREFEYLPNMPAEVKTVVNHMMIEASNLSNVDAAKIASIVARLLTRRPLTALTGKESEWNIDGTNKRCDSVVRRDGKYFDLSGKVFWHWVPMGNGRVKMHYTSNDSAIKITFPYLPNVVPEYREPKEG